MYRLKAKFSPIVLAAVVIFGAVIVIFPQQPTFSGGYHFHYAVLILIELGISLVAAFILFDRGNFVQKYKVSLSVLALSCFYGTLGNIFYNFWKINPGMDLEFSTAQVVIMNLGGVLTALALYKLEPIDAFSDGGLDRLQKGKTPQAEGAVADGATAGGPGPALQAAQPAESVTSSPKTSVNKLRGITSSKTDMPAQEAAPSSTPTEEKKYTSPPQVEIDLEASDEMLSGPLNPTPQAGSSEGAAATQEAKPSATGNRMQAAKRRNTSTFTKLQALSASGTGSLSAPEPTVTESSGDLRSLLDRLDTEEEEETANEAPKAPEAASKPLATPAPQAKAEPKPVAEVKPKPAPRKKEKFRSPVAISAEYLFDELESKAPQPTPEPVQESAPKPAPEPTPEPAPEPAAEAKPDLESLLDRQEEALPKEEKAEAPAAAPEEESKEEGSGLGDSVSGLLSKRFMELSDEDEDEEEKEAPAPAKSEEELITPPEEAAKDIAAAVEEEIASAQDKVFEAGVDSEIDDIFSTLAPEEAQKEVGDEPKEEPQAQLEEKPEEKAEEKLFDQDVGSEIDDIFSGLAPEEAQKEVGETKTAKVAAPEEEAKPAPQAEEAPKEEDSEAIFKLQDDDVDDIFAGLTTEDQKEVDASTLAKVKEKSTEESPDLAPKTVKQTGEMPALNKEQAAKIREKANKPGRFSDTLSKIPSLKNTVEGLLHSLEEEQVEEDSELDLEPEEEMVPEENLSAEQKAAKEAAKKLKDFGRLSSKAVAKPSPETESQGTMKTIGKLLIDKQAVEKIIKSGESKELGKGLSNARIISAARGKGISDLLTKIDEYEGVVGSIVVGHDGLVMASTLREGWDKDMMGALSTALLSTSNLTTKKLEIGKLRQMVMLTKDNGHEKTTVLTDVDVGILAVFVEETDVAKIDGLLTTIQETIHG